MLQTGKAYSTASGRRFLILAKKNFSTKNGAIFVGECTRTGLVTFFRPNGENPVNPHLNLNCDRYMWIGLLPGNGIANANFEPREDIEKDEGFSDYIAFLRIENNDATTIRYYTLGEYRSLYA